MRHGFGFLWVFVCLALFAPSTALAANVLVVLDGESDTGIATALIGDGHEVTLVTNDLSPDGTNPTLVGDLSAYDVVFWSGDGCSGGSWMHQPATLTALTAYVSGGGRVFYTGYDSTVGEVELVQFLGFSTGNDQVGVAPTALASLSTSLTDGVRDIRGVVPSDGYTDKDCVSGSLGDATILSESSGRSGCAQWSIRSLGDGEVAWVSNGQCGSDHTSWTNGSSAFNAAIRNFAFAADASSGVCTGSPEGSACSSTRGDPGSCHGGRCCTGCWDGAACRSGRTTATCGIGGGACIRCAAVAFCASNSCEGGVCSGSPCDDGESCTTDSCDEATDRCGHAVTSGCIVGGECVGDGEHHVAYPCLVCDPARDPSDWSPVDPGTSCGADRCATGRLFQGGTCDAEGVCVAPRVSLCDSLTCHDDATCEPPCTATSCGPGARCDAGGVCRNLLAPGEHCTASDECGDGGACVDGVCCTTACDGSCESCNLPGKSGTCTAIADGTDPYAECNGERVCDGAGACRVGGARDAGPVTLTGDGGIDDGGFDAGVPDETPRGGCSVHAGARRDGGVVLLALGLMFVLRRRRRAGSTNEM